MPGILVDHLTEHSSIADASSGADLRVTTLGIDIVGFTPLTEELSSRELDGVEDVQLMLNDVFEPLLSIIERRGGRVVHFAGDSITALWTGQGPELVDRVADCGVEVVDVVSKTLGHRGHTVEVRVGVGLGPALLLQLGGVAGRWHCLVAGPAMESMGAALSRADVGEVVLAPEAAGLAERVPLARTPAGFGVVGGPVGIEVQDFTAIGRPDIPDQVIEDLRKFVSEELAERIVDGPSHWLSEFRPLSIVFVNLPRLDVMDPRSRNALQLGFRRVQELLEQFEGSLTTVAADEKGITLMLGFGLAPWAHEDDASRAVRASQAIHAQLLDLQLEHGIGVATGRTFCGIVGSDVHREYTLIGTAANLGARLMQIARNDVLCDETTVAMTRGRVVFSGLDPVHVKGMAAPVETYRPSWQPTEGVDAYQRLAAASQFVGRERERDQMTEALDAVVNGGRSGLLLIEGVAGIGKSALAGELIHEVESRALSVYVGAADPIEVDTPYAVWRGVFERLLGFDVVVDPGLRRQVVREQLADEGLSSYGSLLDAVLPVGFAETQVTAELATDGRRRRLNELLLRLIARATEHEPAVVVLEDAQWFDPSSWELLRAVEAVELRMLIVLTGRTDEQGTSPEFEAARQRANTCIELGRVDGDDVIAMACERLGVNGLPDAVAALIRQRGEGHPLFTIELASSLRDRGVVTIDAGQLRLDVDPEQLELLDLPDSVVGLLMRRIDRLTPAEQMTLKVAAVLGRTFDVELLAAVHPARIDPDELAAHLVALETVDLISTKSAPTFAHALIQDAAYRLTSRQLRTELHGRVAGVMKDRGVAANDFRVMAHHLSAADDDRAALDYLEASAAAAFEAGAIEVAGHLYENVIELAATPALKDVHIPASRYAYWFSQLGESDFERGRAHLAKERHVRALRLLGVRVPRTTVGAIGSLCWQIVVQLAHLLIPPLEGRCRNDRRQRQAAAIAALLGKTYYYEVDILRWALVELKSINHAERVADPGVAGSGYAGLGTLVGILRMHSLARRYFARARRSESGAVFAGLTGPIAGQIEATYAPGQAVVASMAEGVYLLQTARPNWPDAVPMLDEAIDAADLLVDPASMGAARTIRAACLHLYADIDDLERAARDLAELGRRDQQHLPHALALLVPLLLERDEVAEALAASAELLDLADLDALMVPMVHACRALSLASSGDHEGALDQARRAVDHLGSSPIFTYRTAFTSLLGALMLVVERADDAGVVREAEALARRTRRRFRWFAVVSPFARTASLYYRALAAGRAGRTGWAKILLHRALKGAVRHGYRWDEARAVAALARLETPGSRRRQELEHRARDLYARLGVDSCRRGAADGARGAT